MKVLFIVFNQIGRGTYLRAFELARALTRLGYKITILASSAQLRKKPKVRSQNGIQILEVSDLINGPTRSGWDIYNLITRQRIVKQLDFDLVHGFESRPTVIYPALALQKQCTSLFLDWADWFGSDGSIEERPNPLIRMLLRPFEDFFETHYRKKPLGTTAICKALAQRAIDLGVPQRKVCQLPNGFDVENWNPISIEKARSQLNLDSNQFLAGYLGSFFPKDANLMADTINLMNSQNQKIRFLHVGHSNYPIQLRMENAHNIIETGLVDFQKMQTYLSACDVLLLPFTNSLANNGRFPLKFSNYLASGRPIIATQVGDIPSYIEAHQCGIVTPANPDALVQAILHLQDHPQVRLSCGQSALALSNHPNESWQSRAKTLMKFYIEKIESEK